MDLIPGKKYYVWNNGFTQELTYKRSSLYYVVFIHPYYNTEQAIRTKDLKTGEVQIYEQLNLPIR